MTIYATCFQNFIGVKRHLQELGQFGVKFIELNQINQVTTDDCILVGAWEPNLYSNLIRRCHAKKKALLVTSPLLQMQMNEPELCYLETILRLKGHGVIDYLLFADYETWQVFSEDSAGIYHLPHPADPKKIEQYQKDTPHEDVFCFMPYGNKNKNQMVQLAAVKLFQKKNPGVVFHANGMGPWSVWADNLGLKYVDHGFLPEDKYYESINNKRCGIHITLSESFAYSVLDGFLLEVPIVCSPAIDWAPNSLIVSNPDDPMEIADRLDDVYYGNTASYGKAAKKFAMLKIGQNNEKAKEVLETIFS